VKRAEEVRCIINTDSERVDGLVTFLVTMHSCETYLTEEWLESEVEQEDITEVE